ncbi:serine hydrolase [Fodinicurvata sp. EGI_FJ10296]|uniref:serine hydrolase domain-containing protein n=1 Tax=Fodinicurvata sp. EGI_FJ10296 TaxID=3231908 RepID=UPI00345538DD
MVKRRLVLTGMAGLAITACTPSVWGQDAWGQDAWGQDAWGQDAWGQDGGTDSPGTDAARPSRERIDAMLSRAPDLGPVHTIIAAHNGTIVAERHYAGPSPDAPANIKSLSKTLLSALVGIAIDRGVIAGPDQPIVDLLGDRVPSDADPAIRRVTVDHLLSMRAGLERTSGSNYGRWVTSSDWVRFALSRPFVAEPGTALQYSTGTWHILSEILTRQSGRTTHELARDWLGEPLGVTIPPWPRDPRGIYFGGNDMLISPRGLLRFGEMYRNGGVVDGRQVVSRDWIETSWRPRAVSPFSNHAYGFGWFMTELGGHIVYYGRGYGGQLLHVVPDLDLTVVITSDPTPPSAGGQYVRALHRLVESGLIEA